MFGKKFLKTFEPDQQRKLLWIAGAVLVAAILLGNQGFRQMISSGRQVTRLKTDLAKVQNDHIVLSKELTLLAHDMSYLERLARKELGLIQPGEIEFRFVPESSPPSQ